jgi:protein tyrosine/serine phosphatase
MPDKFQQATPRRRRLQTPLEYPVLFHCKSGADRAGMMAALFLVLH